MSARVYAVYADPDALIAAVKQLRARGYDRLEAYTPYPVEGLAEALGHSRSALPSWAFCVGLTAAAITYFIQWLLNDYLYPLNVGARPAHFPLSYVPICFEMGILFAALASVTYVAVKGRFGQLWDPVFELPQFGSVTRDRHWLELSTDDDAGQQASQAVLRESGAREVIIMEGASPCA